MACIQTVGVPEESDASRAAAVLEQAQDGYTGGGPGLPLQHLIALVLEGGLEEEAAVQRELDDARPRGILTWEGYRNITLIGNNSKVSNNPHKIVAFITKI